MRPPVHPLERWFRRSGESKNGFMKRTGISRRTLFDVLGSKNKDYGVRTLARIEKGTGGKVTIGHMVAWLRRYAGTDEATDEQIET